MFRRLCFATLAVATALACSSSAALADGTPNISATVSSSTVLHGTDPHVTVTASNPSGTYGYNLSFRVVLPAGVTYAGGASVAPRELANQPSAGQRTLLFENVSDLSPGSSRELAFDVAYSTSTYDAGGSFAVTASAFANSDPRYVPKFTATGAPSGPSATSFTGYTQPVSGMQTLKAVEVRKTEPSPEGEILRGVHDHQTVYTLTVANNGVHPTTGTTLDDYLPAGLEFLGCGGAGADHSSSEEYPGAGAITVPTLPGCTAPLTVATETVDPDGVVGPLPNGVYTHVTWAVGTLSAGGTRTFTYRAAVPMRANTTTFTGATPSALSLGQATNLDNNSGPEVTDETALANHAIVAGTYQGAVPTAVSDATTLTRTAEDWVVRKAGSASTLAQGALTTWTLTFQTSEYKFADHATVTDTLPSGLCPLGATNLTSGNDGADAECDPVGGQTPSAPYTSVAENADGTWSLTWDESTFPQLAHTSVNDTFTLTFPSRTRQRYQASALPTTPILTRDEITNTVATTASGLARCLGPGNPDCSGGGTRIDHDGVDGSPIPDASSAGQIAGDPVIDKRVAASGTNCQSATYVTTVPHYHPGDRICWKLRVDFPGALDTSPQAVADFLPAGVSYEAGSEASTAANSVAATVDETSAAAGMLSWTVTGGTVPNGGRVFERVISTIAQPVGTAVNGDIVGNLMKFSSTNTASVSVPQRDQADYVLDTPVVGLTKGVERVVRGASVVNGPNGPNVDDRTVKGGDLVTYRVDVTNTGAQDARDVGVWDLLPAEYPCPGSIGAISDAGTCGAADRLEWTIPTLAAGATKTLTYTATVPADVGPGRPITNHAGVHAFEGDTNLGTRFNYRPANNIDGAATPANAPAADDTSRVIAANAGVAKSRASSVTEGGNDNTQATIGEDITYTVTATVPEGTTLGGAPALTDTLDSTTRQPYLTGTATATFNGGALPGGFALDTSGAVPRVTFPNDYANAPGSGDDVVVLTFKTRVADAGANTASSGNLTNSAALAWTDPVDGAQTRTSPTVTTQIVEPSIAQTKTDDKNPARVDPDEIVTYTVRTSNASAARTSTAHDVSVSDAVPVGLTPIGVAPGNAPLADGDPVPGSGGAVWDAGTRTIAKQVATIAPGANDTFTYRARVDNPAVGGSTLTNTVSAATASLDAAATGRRAAGSRYAATATDTIRIGGASVSKSGTPATATIGAPVTYTVRVTIPASISLYDATVTDIVPDSIDVDGYVAETCVSGCPVVNPIGRYAPVAGAGATTTVAWDIGDIVTPLATPLVLDLSYTGHVRATHRNGGAAVIAGQTAVNSVTVATNRTDQDGAFAAGTIPTGFDDASAPATATTTVIEPRMTVDKAVKVGGGAFVDGPATANSDDALTYRVVVRNTGNAPAYDVDVTDAPDAELTGVALTPQAGVTVVDGWAAGDPDIAWRIDGPIAPGAAVTLLYTASFVSASALRDGDAVDNTAAVPHYFGVAGATRSANPGTVYRDYINGGSDAVQVRLDFPTFSAVKTTGAAGFPDTAPAEIGQAFAWRVVVTNTSATATATNVRVTDTLPANWSYKTGSATLAPGGGQEPAVAGSDLEWTIASLAPGASITIAYSATAQPAAATTPGLGAGAHVNRAAVTAALDEAGNAGTADGPYASAPDTATSTLLTPALALAKTPDHGAATAGAASSFTIAISNTGSATARSLDVTDVLPDGLSYAAGTATASPAAGFSETSRTAGPGAGETTVHWRVASLAAGAAVTVTVPVTVASGTATGTTLTNAAGVTSDELPTPTTDTGSLDVTTGTDVSVVKSGAATYAPGAQYTWHLRARNLGPSDAQAVTLTDALPTGTTFVSASAPCTHAAGTVTCALGTLANGADQTYDVVVAVDPALTVPGLANTATIATTTPDGDPSNDSSTSAPTVAPLADVSVVKTASPSTALVGHGTTFTLTVHNAGPSVARGVTLVDPLPAELPFASVDSGACAHAAGTITCTLGDLTPGADAVIHVTVTTPVVGTWRNTATVATTTPEPAGGGAPNSADADVVVTPVAELGLTKTAPASVAAGGEVTWELSVTNHGPANTTGVTISDPLPDGTSFVSSDPGCTAAGGVVTCAIGALANGASATRHVTARVPAALGDSTLLNTATAHSDLADDVPGNDSATASTLVGPAADVAIVKSGPATVEAGGTIVWTLAASNAGPSAATGVRVVDVLPAGVALTSATASQGGCDAAGGTVECELGTLAAGAAAQIQVIAQVPAGLQGSALENRASIAGSEPDPDPGNNASSATTTVGPPRATDFDLAIVKSVVPGTKPELGAPLRFTLTVSNAGPATANAVKVVDTLPGGLEYVSASLPGGTCGERDGTVACTLAALPAGATALATVTARVLRAGTVRNTASVGASVADRDPGNDRSVAAVEVEERPAVLRIVKTAGTTRAVSAGSRVRLRLRVTNTSSHAAANVVVCDDPGGATTYVRAAGARFHNGQACWTVGLLPAGASKTFTITVRVNRRTAPGTLRAGATAKASNARAKRAVAKVRVKRAVEQHGGGGVTG